MPLWFKDAKYPVVQWVFVYIVPVKVQGSFQNSSSAHKLMEQVVEGVYILLLPLMLYSSWGHVNHCTKGLNYN